MELKRGHDYKGLVCLYEGIGVAFIMIAINWSSVNPGWGPIAVGCTVAGAITCFDQPSGSHFNPAVTLAQYFYRSWELKKNFLFAISIIMSQILGGAVGVFIVYLTLDQDDIKDNKIPGVAILCPPLS